MVLEVICNRVFVSLEIDEFIQLAHIKLIPDSQHPLIPRHQLLLELDPEVIDTLLDQRRYLLLIQSHVRHQICDLFLSNLVSKLSC